MTELHFLVLQKGEERYLFLYDVERIDLLLETFAVMAGDPELSFTWYDSAVLTCKAQQMKYELEVERT